MALNFQIDRTDPPRIFYTVVGDIRGFKAGVSVFAQATEHPNVGYMTLGVVSRQTPFGQQGHFGFASNEIRRATDDEIRAALGRDHELGRDFVPAQMAGMSTIQYQFIKLRWTSIAKRQREAILQMLSRI